MGFTEATRPLHVLTLTPFFPSAGDEVGGCFVSEPLRELASCNVVSTVIAAHPVHHRRRRPSSIAPARWVRYPQIPGNFGLSGAGRLLFARVLRNVRAVHRQHAIDVIHAHAALPCGHAGALLSRTLGIPFVVTVHGLDVFNTCFQRGVALRWRREVSAEVYRQARRVICISDKVRRLIQDGLGEQICCAVVYNGTNTDLFSPAEETRQQGRTILIVGNLQRGKGHELVLQAMARLTDRYGDLRCRIVGEGPDRSRFAAVADQLGIRGRIEFLGRRSRAEVAEEMRMCTLFVLPSRNEALGCVYLEAMACAKPVIACRGQGIEEIIRHGENGWLIPVDGLDALVNGLATLLDSSERCAGIGQAARQTVVEQLTLRHQAQNLVRVYQEATR